MKCLQGQLTPGNAHEVVYIGDKKRKHRSVSAGFRWCKSETKVSCKEQDLIKVKDMGE